jgi:hypothetical protein
MSGEYSRTITPGFSAGGAVPTSQADTADTVAFSFSTVWSSDKYYPESKAIKNSADTFPLNFSPHAPDAYNAIFTTEEHLAALDGCRVTSPDPDGIHNEMLSHLPLAGKKFFLSVYNRVWTESLVPDSRKETGTWGS